MRRALLDGTTPDQTGRGLAVAHHYRMTNHYHTTGTRTEVPPHASGFPLPQAGLGKTQKWDLRQETPSGFLSRSNGSEKYAEKQVRSKGMPHVGHADSITNDEHGSRSDISD